MTPDIVIQPAAETEITEAFHWYEAKSDGLGSEFVRVLDATLSAIQRNPNSYAIVLACFHASRAPKPWDDKG